jgi:phospholipid-binding lipoprotein MlaA
MAMLRALSATALALAVLAGCVGPRAAEGPQDINDPFENFNRFSFAVTLAIDKAVARPVAVTYRSLVPESARETVRNFLNNLSSPIIFTNDILQGELDRAGVTFIRAGVNTSLGFGGLVDVAARWGYVRHYEDFGQTLGTYGIGEGPYIFLPLVGPANPRDLLGRGVDFALDPLTYAQWREKYYWMTGRAVVDYTDLRARNIETLDEIEQMSLDFYASVRSLYRQSRANEVRNGASEVQDLPDF